MWHSLRHRVTGDESMPLPFSSTLVRELRRGGAQPRHPVPATRHCSRPANLNHTPASHTRQTPTGCTPVGPQPSQCAILNLGRVTHRVTHPDTHYSHAPVAQGIEQRFPKPCVAGSNPAGGTARQSAGVILCAVPPYTALWHRRSPSRSDLVRGIAVYRALAPKITQPT